MNRKAYVKNQTINDYFKEAKSYKVDRSKINDENQKMGAKIEETAFSERNKLTRDKETQYKTYLKWKLGCKDVRIHNWKLVDLSNGYKEEKRGQQLDDKLPDVIVEFSCEGYFHNKLIISYNEIKDKKAILEVMYSVYEYDQLDLNITDKKILEEQIKKTRLWIKEKICELQKTKDNQKLKNDIEKAKQALAVAKEMVEKPNLGEDESRKDFVYVGQNQLPQFEAAGIEEKLRKAFAKLRTDLTILEQNNNNVYVNDIEINVADPFDYLRWWYPGPFKDKSKQQIVKKIATNNDLTWLNYGGGNRNIFKNRIGYAFKVLQAAFKDAVKTLDPNKPNEDPDIPLFNTTNLSTSEKKIAEFGTPINRRTEGALFTLKYEGKFYYVMVDADDNIKEIRPAKYLNEEAAAEKAAIEAENSAYDKKVKEAGLSSDEDYVQSSEDEDYIYGRDSGSDSDS